MNHLIIEQYETFYQLHNNQSLENSTSSGTFEFTLESRLESTLQTRAPWTRQVLSETVLVSVCHGRDETVTLNYFKDRDKVRLRQSETKNRDKVRPRQTTDK